MNDRPAGPPNPFDTVAGPMGAMMGPWLQMMRVWGDAMNTMAPGMGAAAWGMPWAVATSREVSVLVSAAAPVEVRAQVQCGDGARLTLEPLSREGGGAPAIASVAIAPVEQHIRVSVTIPSDQPAGRYRGTVRDGTGRGCGSVMVDIGAGRPQA